jgi:signal transduction histidine kinase
MSRDGQTANRRSPRRRSGAEAPDDAGDLQQLLHTFGHDLRNPIGSILGYVDLLRDTAGNALGAEHLGFLGRIEENCREMLAELARFTAELDRRIEPKK